MLYEDFCVFIDAPQDGAFPVIVLRAPAGAGARGIFRPPFGQVELDRSLRAAGLRGNADTLAGDDAGRRQAARTLRDLGARLFEALFQGAPRSALESSLAPSLRERDAPRLRVTLVTDHAHPELAALLCLPWELLYWRERRTFVGLGPRAPLVRAVLVPQIHRAHAARPVRVLLASASPRHPRLAQLDVDAEREHLAAALRRLGGVHVEELGSTQPEALRARLRDGGFHVWHFMGHGTWDDGTRAGALLLETAGGEPYTLSAERLAHLVHDVPSLQLAVLNACETARVGEGEGADPFGGVAQALLMAGVPAVVAMQHPIWDDAAETFAQVFYARLAAGEGVGAATAEGRLALDLHTPEAFEWCTPVAYTASLDPRGLDAGPLDAGVVPVPAASIRAGIHDFSRLIEEKTEGFVGRGWLFARLDAFLERETRGYFRLIAQPGFGKSAWAARLVRTHGCVHHFNVRSEGITATRGFVLSVAAQIVAAAGLELGALPEDAARDGTFLSALLERAAARLPPGGRLLLLVDALDEADLAPPGSNTLLLPLRLPPGVFVVVTQRPGDWRLYVECPADSVDAQAPDAAVDTLRDARTYVESRVHAAGVRAWLSRCGLREAEFVETVAQKSQGNFMYLRHALADVEAGRMDCRLETLPVKLEGFYQREWDRLRAQDAEVWIRYQLPVLQALTVTTEALPVHVLVKLTDEFSRGASSEGADRRRVRQVLDDWRQYLRVEEATDAHGAVQKRYRLYHESFFDFMRGRDAVKDGEVDLKRAHRVLGRWLARQR